MTASHPLYKPSDEHRRCSIDSKSDLPPEPYRTNYRRDYARLTHTPAFRRLQGKTQLYPGMEGDFFRNRLTHSLEVAQIAKSIAIRLNETEEFLRDEKMKICTDIVEFAGLAHDLGHPPFGHTGEEVLDELMLECGGFEGKRDDDSLKPQFGYNDEQLRKIVGLLENFSQTVTPLSYKSALDIATNGYLRTELTSKWVDEFIRGVQIRPNERYPELTEVLLEDGVREKVEVLKHFVYEKMIHSSRLRIASWRGKEILREIFTALKQDEGYKLLPEDYRWLHQHFTDRCDRMRVICDFIAGMTDRYSIEFYGRLTSENPETIFKPL